MRLYLNIKQEYKRRTEKTNLFHFILIFNGILIFPKRDKHDFWYTIYCLVLVYFTPTFQQVLSKKQFVKFYTF